MKSLYERASRQSLERGYEYYLNHMVISYRIIEDGVYCGQVKGADNNVYDVKIDLNLPINSECSCPYADGRTIVCKHQVALYFEMFPDEAEKYRKECEERELKWYNSGPKQIKQFLNKQSKSELSNILYHVVLDYSNSVFYRFIDEYDIDINNDD